jgi:uncharacterized damage-inducible protein DinB
VLNEVVIQSVAIHLLTTHGIISGHTTRPGWAIDRALRRQGVFHKGTGSRRSPTVSVASLYVIGDLPGYSPQIGRLVSMMNYVRAKTIEAVAGLTMAELDHLHDARSNSIGTLLLHIAGAEVGYQAATFESRHLSAEEMQEWGPAIALGENGRSLIRGHALDYYTGLLEQVRARTLAELGRRDDAWLEEEAVFGNGTRVNTYFKWFHVIDHEISHRGQILWLRSRVSQAGFRLE